MAIPSLREGPARRKLGSQEYLFPEAAERDTVPSLCEWLGTTETLNQLTVKFYERVLADGVAASAIWRHAGGHPRHVVDFIGEVMGGEPD